MSILAVHGLVKTYQRRRVVDGITLEVHAGEIVGLLGPNGAGKSTCFKIICGLVKPEKGEVFLQGTDVTHWPLYLRSRQGMGYLPQHTSLFTKLTVQANLIGMMQLLSFTRQQQQTRCEELLEQFNIAHVRKSLAENLSGGERRRLEIARCLIADPKIIMLDEPFAAIDPVTVQSIQQVIRQLAAKGIAVLVTDHAAREILQISDRTYVVDEGRILCSGSTDEIVNHEQVKRKYLGELEVVNHQTAGSVAARPAVASFRSESSTSEVPVQSEYRFDQAAHQTADEEEPSRPQIVFSKPRRRPTNSATNFRSTDLD